MHHPEIIEKLESDLLRALSEDEKPIMSIDKVAKLLGIDNESLRVAIANGTCPFGFGGQHRISGNRFGRVHKLPLYYFLTNGKGLTIDRLETEIEEKGIRLIGK